MDVLRNMITAVRPGGVILDLQVVRPGPVVEVGTRKVCEIDGEPLLRLAETAARAVDAQIAAGTLAEIARDDHDVRRHYVNGADLVDDIVGKCFKRIAAAHAPRLRKISRSCAVRERCRLRLLSVRP